MKEQCIFAGFGGQGMLLIGKFLAEAGMETGKHVSWLPSYGPEMRGGTANCSVVVSDKPFHPPFPVVPSSNAPLPPQVRGRRQAGRPAAHQQQHHRHQDLPRRCRRRLCPLQRDR